MARRFFVEDKDICINENNINVIGPEVHHINVLRHKIGDLVKINNYIIKILEISNEKLTGRIEEIEELNCNNRVSISLYQSYIKADKMEYVVQKAVELGINKIVPFLSKNCVVKLDNKDRVKKLERLNKISLEASKQCGRNDIVKIGEIFNITDEKFREELLKNDFNILAYENSRENLKICLNNLKDKYVVDNKDISIGVIIGPEGGFDISDMDIFNNIQNICEVNLGTNILRAETASLNLISIISYEFKN